VKFSDALAQQETSKGPACSFVDILANLDDDDRAALLVAFDSTTSSTHIERALREIGVKVSSATVRRHRRGECGCGRG
jgi:hypothetical protein